MANEPLLPCPFCGGKRLNIYKSHGGPAVQCMDCGVRGVMLTIWNRRALARARNDALEEAARAATGFLVGDPANGVPLRNPMPHEIADRIRALKSKEPKS